MLVEICEHFWQPLDVATHEVWFRIFAVCANMSLDWRHLQVQGCFMLFLDTP